VSLDFIDADQVLVMIRAKDLNNFYLCNYNITALSNIFSLSFMVTNNYLDSDSYNGLTQFVTGKYVVAYYKHLFEFTVGTGMTKLASTSASTYPMAMAYVSSFSSLPSGALVILNSELTSGTSLYVNIVDYSTFATLNSMVFKSNGYQNPFSLQISSSNRVFILALQSPGTDIELISTDLNFCHTCSNKKFSNSSSFNPVYVGITPTPSPGTVTGVDVFNHPTSFENITGAITVTTTTLTSSTVACSRCKNSVIESGESCEDNDSSDGDGCSSSCVTESGYQCGTQVPVSTCSTCGYLGYQAAFSEPCDDMNSVTTDGCIDCVKQPGYSCVNVEG